MENQKRYTKIKKKNQKMEISLKSEKTIKMRKSFYKMKNHF